PAGRRARLGPHAGRKCIPTCRAAGSDRTDCRRSTWGRAPSLSRPTRTGIQRQDLQWACQARASGEPLFLSNKHRLDSDAVGPHRLFVRQSPKFAPRSGWPPIISSAGRGGSQGTTSVRDDVAAPDVDAACPERAVWLLGGGVDGDIGAGPELALVADEVSVDPGIGPDDDLLLTVPIFDRHDLAVDAGDRRVDGRIGHGRVGPIPRPVP